MVVWPGNVNLDMMFLFLYGGYSTLLTLILRRLFIVLVSQATHPALGAIRAAIPPCRFSLLPHEPGLSCALIPAPTSQGLLQGRAIDAGQRHGSQRPLASARGRRSTQSRLSCRMPRHAASGSISVNTAPPSGALAATMRPPCAWAIHRAMANPRPVPSTDRSRAAR